MKAKKLLALLMSLVLLLGALAVPALAADDGTTGDSAAAGSSEAASEAASDAAADPHFCKDHQLRTPYTRRGGL